MTQKPDQLVNRYAVYARPDDTNPARTMSDLYKQFKIVGLQPEWTNASSSVFTIACTKKDLSEIVSKKAEYALNGLDIKEGGKAPLTAQRDNGAGYVQQPVRGAAVIENDLKLG
jgi:hypothetical protein